MKKLLVLSLWFIIFLLLPATNYPLLTAHAIVDPLSVPNNKFGIHIIQATPDESSPAASLVNTNGDWGYITFLIESKDRNHDKWQEFFNDLRRRHLIPLVRLATKPINQHWERPYEGEEQAWADFLDNLNWPTKNRYIIIYNEPNHAQEWGNFVDAKNYAKVLDQTITALKNKRSLISSQGSEIKNSDFFVLNAGFDASAPSKLPDFEDQVTFMNQMNQEVPGIFEKLDGWVSHSYPNPNFSGSPDSLGRGTVRTFLWEMSVMRSLGVSKDLPIFITETGWKHSEGINNDPSLPSPEIVAFNLKRAFENIWASSKIVAVTPFLLNYQEPLFDHFSFKKINTVSKTDYYPQYQIVKNLPKINGQPIQENKAQLTKGEIYSSIVSGETYKISLTFKNSGQSIWNDPTPEGLEEVRLVPIQGGNELGIEEVKIPKNFKIEPEQEYTFNLSLKAPQKGSFKVVLNLFLGSRQFDSKPLEFATEVKPPVILLVQNSLKWKKSSTGDYFLRIEGTVGESIQKLTIGEDNKSPQLEARYLLPDYSFDFTLEKPNYKVKTIHQKVLPGVNILDFGTLEPDFISAILKPKELWNLLPFSN